MVRYFYHQLQRLCELSGKRSRAIPTAESIGGLSSVGKLSPGAGKTRTVRENIVLSLTVTVDC